MNKNSHQHQQKHGHSGKTKHFADDHPVPKKGNWAPHKDWRAWVAIGLMLFAIVAYVLSMDESIRPGEGNEQPPVAADGP